MRCFYHPGYYVPLPDGHGFPIKKYRLTADLLKSSKIGVQLVWPILELLPVAKIGVVHDIKYLRAVADDELSDYDRNRLGLPHHPRFLERSQLDVSGTFEASKAALSDGISWNIGGGTHHAMRDHGLGFCVTNDVAVAATLMIEEYPDLKILVLDTDAHQGNGTHALLRDQPNIFTYSIHVGRNYPAQKQDGDLDVPLERFVGGTDYLRELSDSLEKVAEKFDPDLVFWVSGVDLLSEDKFGQMNLSESDLRKRNSIVVEFVKSIDAVMVGTLSGGYLLEVSDVSRLHCNCIVQSFEEWNHD